MVFPNKCLVWAHRSKIYPMFLRDLLIMYATVPKIFMKELDKFSIVTLDHQVWFNCTSYAFNSSEKVPNFKTNLYIPRACNNLNYCYWCSASASAIKRLPIVPIIRRIPEVLASKAAAGAAHAVLNRQKHSAEALVNLGSSSTVDNVLEPPLDYGRNVFTPTYNGVDDIILTRDIRSPGI